MTSFRPSTVRRLPGRLGVVLSAASAVLVLGACSPGTTLQAGLDQVSPLRAAPSPSPSGTATGATGAAPAGGGAPTGQAPASTGPAKPAPAPSVAATATGWGQANGTTWVTAQLRNGGDATGASSVEVVAYGSGDRVLGFGRTAAVQVDPGQVTAVGTLLDVPSQERIRRLDARVRTAPVIAPRSTSFTLGGVNVRPGSSDSPARLLATVTTTDPAPTTVTALCYDRAGNIIGGGATALGTLSPGGLTAFAVNPLVVPAAPARCSVYTAVLAPAA